MRRRATPLAVLALLLLAGCASPDDEMAAVPSDSASPSSPAPDAPPTTVAVPSITRHTATPTPTPTVVEAPPPPPPAAIDYSGAGDSILEIAKPGGQTGAVVVTLTHQGGSNFAVWALDADLAQTDLLANEIGGYSGSVLMDERGGETARLEITADGPWTVQVRDVRSARELPASGLAGVGSDVLIWRGETPGTAAISGTGDSNFSVWFYGDSADLLVNEIAPYEGTTRLPAGPALLEIGATGDWLITPGS